MELRKFWIKNDLDDSSDSISLFASTRPIILDVLNSLVRRKTREVSGVFIFQVAIISRGKILSEPAYKPNSVSRKIETVVIHLVPASRPGSRDQPKSHNEADHLVLSYLVLHRMGFT